MKRSFINKTVDLAIEFAHSNGMRLPKFAYFTVDDWHQQDQSTWQEVFDVELGWDVTDYCQNDWAKYGTCLFTLRNGKLNDKRYTKPYAEKMMIIEKDQALPYHFHAYKVEDILNRGGGTLCIKLYNSTRDDELDKQNDICLSLDGQKVVIKAGDTISIPVGSGITIPQRVYHRIWAEKGKVMSWEVSKVNDDHTDNYFLEKFPRFSEVDEDEPMKWCLCNEYSKIRS